MMVEVLNIALCMYIVDYQTINFFQFWSRKYNWPTLINKVEHNYLGIFKVDSIWKVNNVRIKVIVAITLVVKKENWESLQEQPSEPN